MSAPSSVWGGGLCLLIACIYLLKWPHPRRPLSSWRRAVLRWAHGAVWLVLGASFFVRTAYSTEAAELANGLALVGAALYVMFVVALAVDRVQIKLADKAGPRAGDRG